MNPMIERACDFLRIKGYKITPQRILILEEVLKHAGRKALAKEIYINCRKRDGALGIATVYRTLDILKCEKVYDYVQTLGEDAAASPAL